MLVIITKDISFPIQIKAGQMVYLDLQSSVAVFDGIHFDVERHEWSIPQ